MPMAPCGQRGRLKSIPCFIRPRLPGLSQFQYLHRDARAFHAIDQILRRQAESDHAGLARHRIHPRPDDIDP